MNVRLWHGWRREPLEPGAEGPDGRFPYFGIIPRGLLNRLDEAPRAATPDQWARVARALTGPTNHMHNSSNSDKDQVPCLAGYPGC